VVSDPKLDVKQTDFEQRAQTLLRERAEQLDGATRSRLTQARHAALAAIERRRSTRYWLLPATGVAAAAVIALVLTNQSAHQTAERVAATAAVDEMEIVTADDSLEFYRDVDFYTWLAVIDEDSVPPEA
jgi:hypothetical protein